MSLFIFFTFCHQLFHLLLAGWEFLSLGIKQFQAGCGTAPEIIFFQFLFQAESDLPPHGSRFAGTGPGSLIEDRTWLLQLAPMPFFLIPLRRLLSVRSTYFIFHAVLTCAVYLCCLSCTVLYFLCISNTPLLFSLSRGCCNVLFFIFCQTADCLKVLSQLRQNRFITWWKN